VVVTVRPGWLAWAVVGALLVTLLAQLPLAFAPFSDRHEAREAVVVADIVRHGHWIAPFPNEDRIPTKGPLSYWWGAAVCSVLGLHPWSIRLAILAWMTGTLAATVALGSLIDSRRTGWIAAGILGTSLLYWRFMLYVRVDPALVFCVTATLLAFTWALSRPRARRLGNALAQLALTGASLAKGLPALVPTLSVVGLVASLRREGTLLASWGFVLALGAAVLVHPALALVAGAMAWLRLRQGPDRASPLFDLAPAVLLVGLVALWLHLADARYPISYLEYVVVESTSRIDAPGPPFWFYLPDFAKQFFPWSLLVPVALAAAVSRVRRRRDDPIAVPLAWLVVPFVLFSCFDQKRSPYVLPLFPAAALLVASVVAEPRSTTPAIRRWLARSEAAIAGVGGAVCLTMLADLAGRTLLGAGFLHVPDRTPLLAQIGAWQPGVELVLAACGAAWAASLAVGGVRRWLVVFAGQAAVLALAGVLLSAAPPEHPDAPDAFAARLAAILPADAQLHYLDGARDYGVVYYLDRRMKGLNLAQLTARATQPPPGAPPLYVLVEERADLPPAVAARAEELARGRGSDHWHRLLRFPAGAVGPR